MNRIAFSMKLPNVIFGAAIAFNSAQLVAAGCEAYHTHTELASDLRDDTLWAAAALDNGNGSVCLLVPKMPRVVPR